MRTNAVADGLFGAGFPTGVNKFHRDHIGFSDASYEPWRFAIRKDRRTCIRARRTMDTVSRRSSTLRSCTAREGTAQPRQARQVRLAHASGRGSEDGAFPE